MGCTSSVDDSSLNISNSFLFSSVKGNTLLQDLLEKLSDEELREFCSLQTTITLTPGECLISEGKV